MAVSNQPNRYHTLNNGAHKQNVIELCKSYMLPEHLLSNMTRLPLVTCKRVRCYGKISCEKVKCKILKLKLSIFTK